MKRSRMLSTLATLALIAGAPALAGPGNGQGGGQGGGGPAGAAMGGISDQGSTMRDLGRMNSQGPANANDRALERANENSVLRSSGEAPTGTRIRPQRHADQADDDDATTSNGVEQRTTARAKSQGAAHANVNGLAHANANSALSVAGRTDLTGLTTDMTVTGTGGTSIGTVSQIITNSSGAVVGIQVELEGGGTVTIPASMLTLDGTVLTTTFVPKH